MKKRKSKQYKLVIKEEALSSKRFFQHYIMPDKQNETENMLMKNELNDVNPN